MGRFCFLGRSALALATAAALFSLTNNARAYAVKKTSHGDLVHWEDRTVEYTLDPSVDRNVAGGHVATTTAMDSWSGTVGAPELRVRAPDDASPTKPGFDRKNMVYFAQSGYTAAGRALAITVLTYDNTSGRILDADLIVNGTYDFQVLASPDFKQHRIPSHLGRTTDVIGHDETEEVPFENVYDLHHVMAHEVGHSLGMNDELGRRDALMYRYSAPNDATMRQPADDDIAGLAELYSTKLEGQGGGCGGATVAPKPPSRTASHVATFATLGFLLFLVLRARSDRRARLAFVLAASAATVAFVPSLSGKHGVGTAQANEAVGKVPLDARALGHARARVDSTSTAIEDGLFKTSYRLVVASCRASTCPKSGSGLAWGGTIGDITQEVGGHYAPSAGDDVDVSFTSIPSAVGALSKPLAGRPAFSSAVRILTRAQ